MGWPALAWAGLVLCRGWLGAGDQVGACQSPCNSLTLTCASYCCISGALWSDVECWSGVLARGATRGRITVNVEP